MNTNGGGDGESTLSVQNKAAIEFARTTIRGFDPQAARDSAQTEFYMNSRPAPYDIYDGDGIDIQTLQP